MHLQYAIIFSEAVVEASETAWCMGGFFKNHTHFLRQGTDFYNYRLQGVLAVCCKIRIRLHPRRQVFAQMKPTPFLEIIGFAQLPPGPELSRTGD
jgi:hypothetical protein